MQYELSITQLTADDEHYKACLQIRCRVFIEEQRVAEAIEIDAYESGAYDNQRIKQLFFCKFQSPSPLFILSPAE